MRPNTITYGYGGGWPAYIDNTILERIAVALEVLAGIREVPCSTPADGPTEPEK